MGFPEPTPVIKGRKAANLLESLERFSLDRQQSERWQDSRATYRQLRPIEDKESA